MPRAPRGNFLAAASTKPSNSSKSLPNSAGKRHPTAAAMASFIGVQGCHLPGLKRSKRTMSNTPPAGCTKPMSAPAVPALQPAVCLHRAQHAPLPHAQRPTSQANGTPTSPTGATPAGKSHHKATAKAQGIPAAAAMASYRRSSLPFARPQTLQTLQKSAQLRRQKVPQQAQRAPRPQAKATTRPQQWRKGTPPPQVDCFDHILLYVDISLPLMTPHHKMINHQQAVRSPTRPLPHPCAPGGVRTDPCPFGRRVQLLAAWEANGHMSVLLSVSLSLSTVPPLQLGGSAAPGR